MPPPTKKQKTSDSIVFVTTGGLKPDTLLNVLGQEFQVHSFLLKAHSAFFAKFLDSVDKRSVSKPASGKGNDNFQYEWISMIDDDKKGWHLIAKQDQDQRNADDLLRSYKGNVRHESECFRVLLCAIYGQIYDLPYKGIDSLVLLVSLADYYQCLPSLSRTINNSLLGSLQRAEVIWRYPSKVMLLAAKIRNKLVFTEALIHTAGNLDIEQARNPTHISEPKIEQIVRNAQNALMAEVLRTQQILAAARRDPNESQEERDRLSSSMSRNLTPLLSSYYRDIQEDGPWKFNHYEIDTILYDLLTSKLVFCPSIRAGDEEWENHFFCLEISDEDLPTANTHFLLAGLQIVCFSNKFPKMLWGHS
ncbi:hypothetical protein VTL71DRAFT_5447 [Oculimacula yallundae]|uniref:BTB domain-containing protein n=1 Tax=Oculimacula yallundae TaxID=86028 RepID=A0ABR4C1R3_9HELO